MIHLRSIAFLLFFFSGFSALVYEVVWARQLSGIFGSTAETLGVVLAVYLSGLALGGIVLGRTGDGVKKPFLFFAILETLIGLYGLLSSTCFGFLESFYYGGENLGFTPPEGMKIVLTGLYLLVPCFLMGGTLPVLSRYCLGIRGGTFGSTAGGLYAVNTLGAAAGAFFTGFIFLEQYGAQVSLLLAAAINLVVAGVAIALYFYEKKNPVAAAAEEPGDEGPEPESVPVPSLLARLSIFLAFFLAGTSTLAHEVIWTRVLSQYFKNSVYSITCMLIAVLLGLAVGGGAGILLVRYTRGRRFMLGSVQLLVGLASLAMLSFLLVPFNDLASYQQVLLRWGGAVSFFQLATFEVVAALCLVFPPAFFMGTAFPLMANLGWRPRTRFAGFMGDLQFLLLAGNVTGSLLTAFVLIPSGIGLMNALLLAVCANGLAALLLLGSAFWQWRGPQRARGLAVVLVLGGAGAWLYLGLPPRLDFWKEQAQGEKLLYYMSDRIAEVAVVEGPSGRVLKVNNTTWLGGSEGRYVETRLGMIPGLVKGNCEQALVMGLGTGNSLQGLLHGGARNVDCVEIISGVCTSAAGVGAVNYFNVLSPETPYQGLLKIFPGMDARVFLRCTDQQYDLILGDLYFPWQAEAGFMYTQEHFTRVRDRLAEGGIFFQWLPLHQLRWEDFGIIGYTFGEVFEYMGVFLAAPDAAYPIVALVGSKDPIHLDPVSLQTQLDQHPYLLMLRELGLDNALELTSLYLGNEWLFRRGFSETVINTEDQTVVEFRTARIFEDSSVISFNNLEKLSDPLFKENAVPILELPEMEIKEKLAIEDRVKNYSEALKHYLSSRALYLRESYLRDWGYREDPGQLRRIRDKMGLSAMNAFRLAPEYGLIEQHLLQLWKLFLQSEEIEAANNLMSLAISIRPDRDLFYNNLGLGLMQDERYRDAAFCLLNAVERNPENFRTRANLAVALFLSGERVQAREEMGRVLEEAVDEALPEMTAALAVLILEGREAALPNLQPFLADPERSTLIRAALSSASKSGADERQANPEDGQ